MKLPQEVLEQIKSIQLLIGMKEIELAALKSHVSTLLRDTVGVDTDKWPWELDQETGELTPQAGPPKPQDEE